MIKVIVNNVISSATNLEVLTAGMVNGRAIEFDLSPDWDELNKTAVFTNGIETRIVPEYKWTDRKIVYIPPEVLSTPHQFVKCGIYGIDEDGKLVIPTLWAELGRVFPSASPGEYHESVPPTPNTWDDLQNQIGNINDLLTEDKKNLVSALNEIARASSIALPKITKHDNGKVLTASDGVWVAQELPKYEGEFEVTPSLHRDTTLMTRQKMLDSDIKVKQIPYNEVSNNSGGKTVTIGEE